MTEPEPLQQVNRTYVRYRNRKLSYFAGCDYFRLSSHPKVVAALEAGLVRYGLSVAASRLTTGSHRLYAQLEARLAGFFGAEAAVVVGSGYVTNLVVAQALAGQFSHALVDEESHPSLQDAATFLDCPVLHFASRSPESLAQALQRCGPQARPLVLTDGLFARDGSTAPLRDYLKILPADAMLLVDDAHGAGVLGRTGQGTLQHAGVGRKRIIQTITLSKAFGSYGGAIVGSAALRRTILNRSRLFVGSTPPPLPLVNAALRAASLLAGNSPLRRRLAAKRDWVKSTLRQAGMDIPDTPGPIVAWRPPNARASARLRAALLGAGIFPSLIQYPGAPQGGYFRFVISSEHTREQLEGLVSVLSRFSDPHPASVPTAARLPSRQR